MIELKAINDVTAEKLTTMEQGALARILGEAIKEQEEDTEDELYTSEQVYTAAVDFLWMAYRITDEEKTKLMALLDELPEREEGWWET